MNKKLVIIGAGGHGKVCAEIAELNGYKEIVFLDNDINKTTCLGYPIKGNNKDVEKFISKGYDVFVAIGNNKIRKDISENINQLVTLIHPQSVISNICTIEKGTVIMPNVVINSSCKIGKGVIINTAATIDHDCTISDYVHISPGAHLGGTCYIGEKAWIGLGSSVINNIEIEKDAIIGAGSVIIRKVEKGMKYVGNPAKMIGGVTRLNFSLIKNGYSLMYL